VHPKNVYAITYHLCFDAYGVAPQKKENKMRMPGKKQVGDRSILLASGGSCVVTHHEKDFPSENMERDSVSLFF
jgi:hypothetical protein